MLLFLWFFVWVVGLVLLPHLALGLVVESAANQLFDGVVDHGEEGNGNDHANNAPQAAEEDDGEQHPETG